MNDIVSKCVEWNSLRYEREYNHDLAMRLILEEQEELFDALASFDNVEVLDACGDIVFVAIGVLWKAGVPEMVIKDYFYNPNLIMLDAKQSLLHASAIKSEIAHNMLGNFIAEATTPAPEETEAALGCYMAIDATFFLVLSVLRSMGLQYRFYDIVNAICESNNTKEVQGKVAAGTKANTNKGEGFVPPTAALRAILTEKKQ